MRDNPKEVVLPGADATAVVVVEDAGGVAETRIAIDTGAGPEQTQGLPLGHCYPVMTSCRIGRGQRSYC